MMEISELSTFLGWCTVLNVVVLTFSSILILTFQGYLPVVLGRFSGMESKDASALYYKFLGNYKICIIVFNLVPYISLKIMS